MPSDKPCVEIKKKNKFKTASFKVLYDIVLSISILKKRNCDQISGFDLGISRLLLAKHTRTAF